MFHSKFRFLTKSSSISLFVALLFLTNSLFVFSQNVKIVPLKVVYHRAENVEKFRREFVVFYPKVFGTTPRLKKKIESSISYWRNFGTSLVAERKEPFLQSLKFNASVIGKRILNVELILEANGAYYYEKRKHLVVDLSNGENVALGQVVRRSTSDDLRKLIARRIRAEIKQVGISEKDALAHKEHSSADEFVLTDLAGFEVGNNGITFFFDFNFHDGPLNSEFAGHYFFSYTKLRRFIEGNRLLAQFLR